MSSMGLGMIGAGHASIVDAGVGLDTARPDDLGLRNGQWVVLDLNNLSLQAELVRAGAHATPGGGLVAIYSAAHVSSALKVTRAGGKEELIGGGWVAPRYILVDANGHNVSLLLRKEYGHVQVVDAFFPPGHPAIRYVRPARGAQELPPGRVFSSRWLESFHGLDQLALEVHAAHGGEMTPAKFLEAFSKKR